MNLADKINVVTGEPDAAEEILGLTAEEANLLSDPLNDAIYQVAEELGKEAAVSAIVQNHRLAGATPEELEVLAAEARDNIFGQSPESAQLDAAVPSGKVAHIPAIDRQIDSVPPAKPVDVVIVSSHIKNPA